MAEKLDPQELVTIEELAISSVWEMAALMEVLERLEIRARESKQGLWGDPNPIPPWEWRIAKKHPL